MKRLSRSKLFRAIQKKLFPSFVKLIMRFILWTSKVELVGLEGFYEQVDQHPSIIMLWHNRVVLGPNFFGEYMEPSSNYTAYVSNSRDGEWLALATESYKNGFTIRVPKFDKHKSLREFIKTLKKSIVLITPDGPVGPAYQIKPGVIVAAQVAKAQIFPFSWSASKYWRFSSWDRMIIPKPFGKIVIGYGEPFFIDPKKEISISEKIKHAEERLTSFKEKLNRHLISK
ncbi:MAG: hypothetical protein S4CHLAM6_11790 [Chlamydiae bacterium]|nr:hypothetical protein [Chlamydiota bacterium]